MVRPPLLFRVDMSVLHHLDDALAHEHCQHDADQRIGHEVGAIVDQAGPGRGVPVEDAC